METFYATLAQICFTLVGLWWIVVQFKYKSLMASKEGRLAAYVATMHFVAPGIISLVAVLTTDQTPIWRAGSVAGSLLGIAATLIAMRSALLSPAQRVGEIILLALFLVLGGLSFASFTFLGMKPIAYEALVNVVVVVLGVQFAWQFFADEDLRMD